MEGQGHAQTTQLGGGLCLWDFSSSPGMGISCASSLGTIRVGNRALMSLAQVTLTLTLTLTITLNTNTNP